MRHKGIRKRKMSYFKKMKVKSRWRGMYESHPQGILDKLTFNNSLLKIYYIKKKFKYNSFQRT